MTEQTAAPVAAVATKATKKAVKKAVKKVAPVATPVATKTTKKVAKKVAPVAAPVATTPNPNKLGKAQHAVLTALSKKDGLTRAEISAKTEISSGFTSLLGHSDPEKREAQSLLAKGFIKVGIHDVDGKNVAQYSLTAAGRKALEAANK